MGRICFCGSLLKKGGNSGLMSESSSICVILWKGEDRMEDPPEQTIPRGAVLHLWGERRLKNLCLFSWILDRCLLENPFLWPLEADCCGRSCANNSKEAGCCRHAKNITFYFTACVKGRTVASLTFAVSCQAAVLAVLTSHFQAEDSTTTSICNINRIFFFAKNPNYVVSPTTSSFQDEATPKNPRKTTSLSVRWVQISVGVVKTYRECASHHIKSTV